MAALFPVGQVVATPSALETLQQSQTSPSALLNRHVSGDCGDVGPEDAAENELSAWPGFRILSAYLMIPDGRLWIITEADRSRTTLLLPSEY